MLVINFMGEYVKLSAQTGKPQFAITIDKETVLKKVLLPAIFAPVTIKNSSLFILKSLLILFLQFNKGCPKLVDAMILFLEEISGKTNVG
jgi:hypothetical protein